MNTSFADSNGLKFPNHKTTLMIALARFAVIGGATFALFRKFAGGAWAAGYWWSKHDRELGRPDC